MSAVDEGFRVTLADYFHDVETRMRSELAAVRV
jgi:hypothetical protein